ncbi:hypothetical protein RN607_05560 [Demequina capsici]|uniref:Uncharacterized protein n=1 Tax=Demequina capsici TaxID=3075620 RepID=A0AA96F867_9MICO|nr:MULTISPECIES: hypothetical protein [unclassified Demequina]WNM25563.1 hypothetical protein RN606_05300 [Demequina sp. OYTSA14]WNM28469.1 hypothetical protein RN607_05560 [Demequina sp. PMTSA13]
MFKLKRGADEIVQGLLLAFVGAPVAYSAVAIVSMFVWPDLVSIGVVLGLGLFALGLLRALQGARHFLRNLETAALVRALGPDEVLRRDRAHDL